MYTGNVRPTELYDAPILGLDDGELRKAEKSAAKVLSPTAPGRSLEATFLLSGSLLGDLPVAAFLRYSREVWVSASAIDPFALSLVQLRKAFTSAEEKGFPEKWAHTKGPTARARLELKRLSWDFKDPFRVVTDQGDTVVLTQSSPALLAKMLRAAQQRKREMTLAVKWLEPGGQDASSEPWSQKRLSHEPIARLLRSAKLQPVQKFFVKLFATNAVWTRQRIREHTGLCISELCPLCRHPRHHAPSHLALSGARSS